VRPRYIWFMAYTAPTLARPSAFIGLVAALALHASAALAQGSSTADANARSSAAASPAAAYAEGEVRRIDKDAGKITLKHGPIASLDMPPMSMVFRAADPAMLNRVKEGDKVRFKADRVQGALTVTEIETVR
jgi:Cu(I)/Ag(I) efflux system protein CusF